MFGKHQTIIDPNVAPAYMVDYRDFRGRHNPDDRWTDRLFPDGTWEANLFQFYQRCQLKLEADLKVPFALKAGQRIDETPVHVALREALINSLIHTDYSVGGGIVVERYQDRYQFSNPGTLLVSEAQLRQGGVSECRNRSLQRMFVFVGGGEQAGSGYARIQAGWRSQHWRAPRLTTQTGPDRVRLDMPMLSLMPEHVFDILRRRIGAPFDSLEERERIGLATALIEGDVTNTRMQDLVPDHPSDLTKMLRGLVQRGFLEGGNQGRWTRYSLPSGIADSTDLFTSPQQGGVTPPSREGVAAEIPPVLVALANRTGKKLRPKRAEIETTILALCNGRYLTLRVLADLLNRSDAGKFRDRYLTPMVADGRLQRLHENPAHPGQAYKTKGT